MADRWVEIGNGFWNIRGTFKVAGVLDVGTQMSVVRRASGQFVLLDSYVPDAATLQQLMNLTDAGRAVEAVINLHPFHTLHVPSLARLFPNAKLYGTARHVARFPELAWQPQQTESSALGELFASDLRFSVPRGVEFVPTNERLHFASVLAFQPSSGVLHVDDTLMWSDVPLVGGLRFHPSLAKVLERRPDAVAEFRSWLTEVRTTFREVRALCTAHMKNLPPSGTDFRIAFDRAVRRVEKTLARHEQRFG